jgi:type I restriction enzyme S subunit
MRQRWQDVTLGQICEFKYGKSLRDSLRSGGDVPVFGSNGQVGRHHVPLTDGPTVVIGRKGSFGEVHFSRVACWPIDTTYYVDKTATAADLRWLSYRLQGLRLTELNRSAAIPGLNRQDAYRRRLLLPPLKDQRRIAEVLEQADDLRDKRRAALAQLDTLTQAIFLDLFGDPATNSRGWSTKLVREVARVNSGEGFPLEHQGKQDGEFPFFKVGDMNTPGNETAMRVAQHTISEDVRRTLRAEAFPPGSIVFPKIGAAIATNKKRLIVRPSCVDNNVMAVVPSNALDVNYFFALIRLKNLSEFAQKGNPPSMRKTDVEAWSIPVPPIPLQRDFGRRVDVVEKLKTAHRASLTELDALFFALQHRAFRGEL